MLPSQATADVSRVRADHSPRGKAKGGIDVLLVEDDDSDVALMDLALDAAGIACRLHVLRKGSDVLPYLTRQGKFAGAPRPDVVLLDLGLPGSDGFEVLAEIAQLPAPSRDVPIIILTGYEHFDYVRKSYNLWIPAYLTKPCCVDSLREAFSRISRISAKPSVQ